MMVPMPPEQIEINPEALIQVLSNTVAQQTVRLAEQEAVIITLRAELESRDVLLSEQIGEEAS